MASTSAAICRLSGAGAATCSGSALARRFFLGGGSSEDEDAGEGGLRFFCLGLATAALEAVLLAAGREGASSISSSCGGGASFFDLFFAPGGLPLFLVATIIVASSEKPRCIFLEGNSASFACFCFFRLLF